MGNLLMRRREMILPSGGGELIENFTRVGNPTIENGIMTASSGNYITAPQSFDPGSSPWEITVKLLRPTIPGIYEGLCASPGVSLYTAWKNANVKVGLHSESGTIVAGSNEKSVPAGSWRWLRVVFGGTAATGYDYGLSTDGVTFTYISGGTTPCTGYRPGAYKTATPIKAGIFGLGSCANATGAAAGYNSVAQFDLMATVIKINGSVWWTPYKRG